MKTPEQITHNGKTYERLPENAEPAGETGERIAVYIKSHAYSLTDRE